MHVKLDVGISVKQLGLRNRFGTLQTLIERCRDVNCDVLIYFVDFEKASDKLQHKRLMNILQRSQMDSKSIRIIAKRRDRQRCMCIVSITVQYILGRIMYGTFTRH